MVFACASLHSSKNIAAAHKTPLERPVRTPYGAFMDIAFAPPDRPTPIIEVRGLTLTVPSAAGPVNILSGIDLDVDAGEAIGIVGPSGSGKTSLLMVLAGLEAATSGSVVVAGQDITRQSEDALARFRRSTVGIVFQSFHLIPTMTALENVSVPLELAGQQDAAPRAAESLRAVGLGHRLTHLPGQLSGGEQQRVALARAFAPRPRLLLADEPTGNLDAATGQVVMDLLFGLRETYGATLLLITHDPALAARCGRQVRIADGRVAAPVEAA
jgi:putative ABC transport system ATP-binding protein